tara:strand:+ start:17150 stop:17446 length:297 start_codon:yes stop_codon:yes gene_type:complete
MRTLNLISLIILTLSLVLLGYQYNKHNSEVFKTNTSMKRIFIMFVVLSFVIFGKLLFNVIYFHKIDSKVGNRGLKGKKGDRGNRGNNAYCKKDLKQSD